MRSSRLHFCLFVSTHLPAGASLFAAPLDAQFSSRPLRPSLHEPRDASGFGFGDEAEAPRSVPAWLADAGIDWSEDVPRMRRGQLISLT